MTDTFFETDGARYVPTPMTRGPWDDRFQHGGPPCALLAGALAAHGDSDTFAVLRLWFDLLRPVPLTPLSLAIEVERSGRTVQRLRGVLMADDVVVVEARALRIRRLSIDVLPRTDPPEWPDPAGLEPFEFPFFRNEVGYHRAVELRLARGTWGATPVSFWVRPKIPLIAGRQTTPLEALVVLADAQSGMGPPLDPSRFTFVNPDLSVALERDIVAGWLGFEVRSTAAAQGAGLAQSEVRDAAGTCARTSQSLVITPRL